jgi:hypothetical protein
MREFLRRSSEGGLCADRVDDAAGHELLAEGDGEGDRDAEEHSAATLGTAMRAAITTPMR